MEWKGVFKFSGYIGIYVADALSWILYYLSMLGYLTELNW